MRHNQRGITMIGWLFLLIPLAIVAYGGIRLAPLYLNYIKIARTLESMKTEIKAAMDDVVQPDDTVIVRERFL